MYQSASLVPRPHPLFNVARRKGGRSGSGLGTRLPECHQKSLNGQKQFSKLNSLGCALDHVRLPLERSYAQLNEQKRAVEVEILLKYNVSMFSRANIRHKRAAFSVHFDFQKDDTELYHRTLVNRRRSHSSSS